VLKPVRPGFRAFLLCAITQLSVWHLATLLKHTAHPFHQFRSIFSVHYWSIVSFITYEQHINKKGSGFTEGRKQYFTNTIEYAMFIISGMEFADCFDQGFLQSNYEIIQLFSNDILIDRLS